ncbi:M15 family metallopeptidase [Candidatus Neomarinimicrobiota bacterium]
MTYVSVFTIASAMPLLGQGSGDSLSARKQLFPIDPKAYLMGHFRPDTTPDFVRLPRHISGGRGAYLRTAAAAALEQMYQAAENEGIRFRVVSATRTFSSQRTIWEGKFTGKRLSLGRNLAEDYPDTLERCQAILEYSSAPGISRHHWGTEVDFNKTDPAYWRQGEGLAALRWLEHNAPKYGYVMAYPPDRDHGYRYEPWHWSYQPMARPILRNYFHKVIADEDLYGFSGDETLRGLPWREWYVNSVGEGLR